MLFIETRVLDKAVDGSTRVLLLDRLQEKGLLPLIRSTRLRCYGAALQSQAAPENHVAEELPQPEEMERFLAAQMSAEDEMSYVRGDLFCVDDYVLFLIFGEENGEAKVGVRAGIVYAGETTEPLLKLDLFCHDVRGLLRDMAPARVDGTTEPDKSVQDLPQWRPGSPVVPAGFRRFVGKQDADALYNTARKENRAERKRAAEVLEDNNARLFLRRAKEAHIEGYASRLLAGEQAEELKFSLEQLSDAGLLQREVLVSCRETGYALFSLPSPDALAVVTVSKAMCSECGASVADEKVEEIVVPTSMASALLEDGSWLVNRLHSLLREIGIPECEIAMGTPAGDGEAHIMVNVCGESFLLIVRDGDLTPALARRMISMAIETETSYLMIIATGAVYNEGRALLVNHARRRARDGNDIQLTITDGAAAAAPELRRAFEAISQRAIAERLCELDDVLGLSANRLITARFRLLDRKGGVSKRLGGVVEASDQSRSALRPQHLLAQTSSGLIDEGAARASAQSQS